MQFGNSNLALKQGNGWDLVAACIEVTETALAYKILFSLRHIYSLPEDAAA